RLRPSSGTADGVGRSAGDPGEDASLLHARVLGSKLGIFDLYFDSMAPEPIWAAQLKIAEGQSHYDVWTSFALDKPAARTDAAAGVLSEQSNPDAVKVSQYRIQAR